MRRITLGGLAFALCVLAGGAFGATAKLDGSTAPLVETDGAGGHRIHVVANGLNGGTAKALNVDANGNLTSASASGTATGNLMGAGQTVVFATASYATAGLQVSGTWVGTLVFEGTVDNATWVNLNVYDPTGSVVAYANQTTLNGQWRINVAGLQSVRVRCSAYTSGTATVTWFGQGAPGGVASYTLSDPGNGYIGRVSTWGNADAQAAATPGLAVGSFGLIFNGATWDRQRSDPGGKAQVSLYGKATTAGDTAIPVYASGGVKSTLVSSAGVPVDIVQFGFADGLSGGYWSSAAGTFGLVYNGATWDRQRTPAIFWSASATATGNTPVWTPTAGKKFRLMRFKVDVTANAAQTTGGVITIDLQDATTTLQLQQSVYVPSAGSTALNGGWSSGWIDLGNGKISSLANNILNVNLSAALTAGNVRVLVAGVEE